MNTFVSFQIEKKNPVLSGLETTFPQQFQGKPKKEIKNILTGFDPIFLQDLADKSLMDRVDTKFMIDLHKFPRILMNLKRDYYALDINQRRINLYETLYFDTARQDLYLSHHNGQLNRYKVRSRQYVNSHLSFLEVKHKNNKKRTIKNRIKISGFHQGLNKQELEFLKDFCPFDPSQLQPCLWNTFYRITLVSKETIERLTLDFSLEFSNKYGRVLLPNLVIAEVKQEGFSTESVFVQEMRGNDIRPGGFSKYCMGTALLDKKIKANNFKPEILRLKKILKGDLVYARNN